MTALERPDAVTPEEALARWRSEGDPADLARLFDLTAPDLYRLALHLLPDEAAAEDALQETFLAVLLHGDRYEPGRPARPWLAAILRHHASHSRRRERRVPDPDRRPPAAAPVDPALLAEDAEERERLHEELKRLPEPYRGVALLRWRYGLDPAAIAEVRGVPVGTVGSWLHRAVAKLRARMVVMPALLLAFRPERGLEGVRDALMRRAASEAAAGVGGAVVTGGALMSAKIAMVAGGVVVASSCVWLLTGNDAAPANAPGPPEAPPAASPAPPPPPATVPPGDRAPIERAPEGVRPFDPTLATATILVKATLKGEAPRMRPIKMDQDSECMKLHGAPALEETVVCEDGHLANVIAYVSSGADRWSYATPREPALLDQRGCMYVPHVLTVMTNQPIAVRNSDPTMHNVHVTPGANADWNRAQLKGAKDLVLSFAKAEVAAKVKCDVHGWMGAKVGVFTHPFHGVTGKDGVVELKVPPGEYEVSSWHEYDKFEKPAPRKVRVAAGETVEAQFEYSTDRR